MAKKLWVGLGIGCGSLILIVVVAVVALGFWAKHKLGGITAAANKIKAQKVEMAELAREYPFQPGADGQVVLTPARLNDYVAVRSDALAAYQKLQSDEDALKAKKEQHDGSVSDVMATAQKMMGEVVDVEQHYVDGLKAHKMSPAEFHAISETVFAEPDPKSPNAALLTASKDKLEALRNAGLDGMLASDNPADSIRHSMQE